MGGIGSKSEADALADLDLVAEFNMLADISGKLTSPKLEALKLLATFKSSQTNHSLPTIIGQLTECPSDNNKSSDGTLLRQ